MKFLGKKMQRSHWVLHWKYDQNIQGREMSHGVEEQIREEVYWSLGEQIGRQFIRSLKEELK